MTDRPGGTGPVALLTVVIPVFEQAAFLPRALGSLCAQQGVHFEVILVDDGSGDGSADLLDVAEVPAPVRVLGWPENRGLGAACNAGLEAAAGDAIAYLPADDVLFEGHLKELVTALDRNPHAVLASTGVVTDGRSHPDRAPGRGLQLVQVAHRRTPLRWRERADLESDDLDLLFFDALRASAVSNGAGREAGDPALAPGGPVEVGTGRPTCEWVRHPGQRSGTFDPAADGGLNVFRRRYRAAGPLRFAARGADPVDERELYGDLELPAVPADAPHVLVVGELAYNPDRITVLAERGLRLTGWWLDDPLGFMTVGPLPFGGVRELPRHHELDQLRADPPDVAYCLLNWRTIPLALHVARALPDLPIVWHFKEAPQRCLARGDWHLLAELYERAHHVLLASGEERDWMSLAFPDRRDPARTTVMDGDLPRQRWFRGSRAGRHHHDGIHTVCVGRPIGLDAAFVAALARRDVHLHLHGAPVSDDWLNTVKSAAPRHVHVHPAVPPPRWRATLSGYDAGWLHVTGRHTGGGNGGDLRRAGWDDLNLPARLPTLAAAGLPILLPDGGDSISAVGRVVAATGAGLTFQTADDAAELLTHDAPVVAAANAMEHARWGFTFESVVDELIAILLDTGKGPCR